MPQPPSAPITPPDYYLVVPVKSSPGSDRADLSDEDMPPGVHTAMLSYVAEAASEEEAIAKVAPIVSSAENFIALVAPAFPRP